METHERPFPPKKKKKDKVIQNKSINSGHDRKSKTKNEVKESTRF